MQLFRESTGIRGTYTYFREPTHFVRDPEEGGTLTFFRQPGEPIHFVRGSAGNLGTPAICLGNSQGFHTFFRDPRESCERWNPYILSRNPRKTWGPLRFFKNSRGSHEAFQGTHGILWKMEPLHFSENTRETWGSHTFCLGTHGKPGGGVPSIFQETHRDPMQLFREPTGIPCKVGLLHFSRNPWKPYILTGNPRDTWGLLQFFRELTGIPCSFSRNSRESCGMRNSYIFQGT